MNCVHDLRKGCGLSHPFSQAARASSWMIIGGYGVFQSLDKSRLGCMRRVQEETREKQGTKKNLKRLTKGMGSCDPRFPIDVSWVLGRFLSLSTIWVFREAMVNRCPRIS